MWLRTAFTYRTSHTSLTMTFRRQPKTSFIVFAVRGEPVSVVLLRSFVNEQRKELFQLERALGIRIERVSMNGESFEKSARPSTWHGAHSGDIRPHDGSFTRGIPASTDRKLISAERSTAGFGDGRTLQSISVPSWMCRVCCSFETSIYLRGS